MSQIENSESLHDRDWKENKPDDSRLAETGRFKTLIKLIRKHDPTIVFDIGCGSGVLGAKVKAWKPSILLHGCDISAPALDRAKFHFEKVWKTNLDVEDIPVGSAMYDVVVCSDVLEHLYDIDHALQEVNRLLNHHGIGLLTVPNLVYWQYRLDILRGHLPIPTDDDRHLHQFTQESFLGKIRKAGMAILSVSGCRVRLAWLAEWKPSVFSDTLVFEVKKA